MILQNVFPVKTVMLESQIYVLIYRLVQCIERKKENGVLIGTCYV